MAGYGSDNGLAAWLTDNGHVLPVTAPAPAILRQRASTYLDGLYEVRLPGVRTEGFAQERAQPRIGGTFNKQPVPSDVIPDAWINASYAAALYEGENPGGLSVAASSAGAIKRERVEGAVDTEYFEGSGDVAADATIKLSAVEGLVAPFLIVETTGASLGLWSVG